MARKDGLSWLRNRGRNGNDLAGDLLPDQSAESLNIVIGDTSLGRKRNGTAAQSFTGGTGFSGFAAMANFIPGQDDTAANFIWLDRSATTKVLKASAGTAEVSLTLISAILATRPQDCSFATLNGKLYISVRLASNVNRTLVYDPGYSTTALRYAGVGTPAAPTAADTGAGGPAATLRYYRVSFVEIRGGIEIRESLYGPSVSRTNTAGSNTRVTKPTGTSPGEGETHWRLAGSTDNATFYILATTVVGTTTFDDTLTPSTYSTLTAIPQEGTNTPIPACKYVLAVENRLLFYGAWEPGTASVTAGSLVTKDGRVHFTPPLDATATNDDEYISNTTILNGWIDMIRNAGSEDRGLMGPLNGQVFPANSRGIFALSPTGDVVVPYRRRTLSKTLGLVNNQSWFVGEDEIGALCLYWLDPVRGPYRYGANGIQWCGYDVFDLWSTINLDATGIVSHGLFDPEYKMALWAISTGASNDPDKIIAFRVQEGRPVRDSNGTIGVRYGWAKWDVSTSSDRCSCLFANAFGATMSRKMKPYFGGASALTRLNDNSATQLNGVSYQAYVTSRAFDLEPFTKVKTLENGKGFLLADAAAVTLTQTLNKNYGMESRASTASLATGGTETTVLVRLEATALAGAFTFQVTLGEAAAVNNPIWSLHRWYAKEEVTDADYGQGVR